MPPIHYLNPPPNPFWDFVSGLEDHPFFAAYGGQGRHPFGETTETQPEQPRGAEKTDSSAAAAEPSEKAKGKQATVEDPPEVDPTTVNPSKESDKGPEGCRGMPFRGRGRFAQAFDDDQPRGHGCHGRGGRHGPPPFAFGPYGPWWARRGPQAAEQEGQGPRRCGGPGRRGGPWRSHHHGPHHHSPPREGDAQQGAQPGERGFDLGQFLNRLGQRLGVDLSGAAEGLGLDRDRFSAPRSNTEVDFEPRADIFDTPADYIIHLSLPGAKKEDVGVDWDGEHSVLRIAGVVHRPGVDEVMLSQLTVDGRKRENGVFEKAIRLGTKRDPASIDVSGINAKMADGVLIVKVPKVEVEHKKRDVPIAGSTSPSPKRNTERQTEKETLFDADQDMYDADVAQPDQETIKGKESAEKDFDTRSETVGAEEQLPKYVQNHADEESDWEKYGSEEEGEYVKINVD